MTAVCTARAAHCRWASAVCSLGPAPWEASLLVCESRRTVVKSPSTHVRASFMAPLSTALTLSTGHASLSPIRCLRREASPHGIICVRGGVCGESRGDLACSAESVHACWRVEVDERHAPRVRKQQGLMLLAGARRPPRASGAAPRQSPGCCQGPRPQPGRWQMAVQCAP